MNRENRFRPGRDRGFYGAGIEVVGVAFNIGKNGSRPHPGNAACRCEEAVRGGNHFIPGADIQRHQGQNQGIGSRRASNCVPCVTICRDVLLEFLDLFSQNKRLTLKDAMNRLQNLAANRLILFHQIDQRNRSRFLRTAVHRQNLRHQSDSIREEIPHSGGECPMTVNPPGNPVNMGFPENVCLTHDSGKSA